MDREMRAGLISFTENGDATAKRAAEALTGYELVKAGKNTDKRNMPSAQWTRERFADSSLIVFVGAVGIAVRLCAPYIVSKDRDPAVIVIDERGRYVIPLLSGHIGGANRAAGLIAEKIGAEAVITTATDINGCFAADEWAAQNGYVIDDIGEIKHISSAVLVGEKLGLCSDFAVNGAVPKCFDSGTHRCGVLIADRPRKVFEHTLCLMPKRFVIGVGSRAGAPRAELIALAQKLLRENGIDARTIAAVVSVELKKDEPAIAELAVYLGCKTEFYTAEELKNVRGGFSESEFVRSVTGVGNVCERAAVLYGLKHGRKTELLVKKTKGNGVTAAAAVMEWSVDF